MDTTWTSRAQLPAFVFGIAARVMNCDRCGVGRTDPPPAIDVLYYEENSHYNEQFGSQTHLYRRFAEELLSTLDGLVDSRGCRLLDVGSGGGFLVEEADALGFTAEGIEANRDLVEWSSNRGLRIRYGDVTLLQEDAERYDVIVLSAILEHVPEPSDLLRSCMHLLTPGGLILVDQANHQGLLPRAFPWGWYAWQPKEHFWHFTPESFSTLASNAGLQVVRLSSRTLHHPWLARGRSKEMLGRNVAAALARLGVLLRSEDGFSTVLRPR